MSMGEVIAAYLMVAVALIFVGLSGLFENLVRFLPPAVTNGMMAGILLGFGLRAAQGFADDPAIGATLIIAYVVLTAVVQRYAIIWLLGLAMLLTNLIYDAPLGGVRVWLPGLPEFSVAAAATLALPLLVTTLSGQYLPGLAILRVHGFDVRARPLLVAGGIASIVAAFWGGISIALASITASFCASPDSHKSIDRRYVAGVAAGAFYCLGGIFAGTISDILIMLPTAVIALLAGLALLPAIQNFMVNMLDGDDVQAGMLTFLFTTSGITVIGIGSAFWGVIIGLIASILFRTIKARSAST